MYVMQICELSSDAEGKRPGKEERSTDVVGKKDRGASVYKSLATTYIGHSYTSVYTWAGGRPACKMETEKKKRNEREKKKEKDKAT
jgi:hypothetical protein